MLHVGYSKAKSSLVRRLIAAENDPAKLRIRAWLIALDDERLSGLGLTSEDIAILRGARSRVVTSDPSTSPDADRGLVERLDHLLAD
jgi:hypothetical protein